MLDSCAVAEAVALGQAWRCVPLVCELVETELKKCDEQAPQLGHLLRAPSDDATRVWRVGESHARSWSLLACTREPDPDNAAAPAPGANASVARFAATAPKPRASAEPPHHGGRGRVRGPAGALLSELRALELSSQQTTAVSAIEADLRGLSDAWAMRGELAQAVAAEVRAGKIDRAKLEPRLKIARDAATEGKARQAKR